MTADQRPKIGFQYRTVFQQRFEAVVLRVAVSGQHVHGGHAQSVVIHLRRTQRGGEGFEVGTELFAGRLEFLALQVKPGRAQMLTVAETISGRPPFADTGQQGLVIAAERPPG